jgi:hypothetical protein
MNAHSQNDARTDPERTCYFCGQPIRGAIVIPAKTGDAWAHFSCWYDGTPVTGPDGQVL